MPPILAHALHGPAEAPVLTLLHPIGVDGRIWAPVLPALARHYRVLVLDGPGHGGSLLPPGEAATLDTLAATVPALWDRLGIARSHVLGLSLGGCLGVALASRWPQRLQSLVVACARLQMDEAARALWLQRAEQAERAGMDALVQPTLQRWFSPDFLLQQPAPLEQVRQLLRACPASGYAASARALAAAALRARLPALRLPVLYLAGQQDQAVSPALVAEDAALTPGARLQTLPGPHMLHLENPDGFSAAVLDFLARLPNPGA